MKKNLLVSLLLLCGLFVTRVNAQYCGTSGPTICTAESGLTVAGFYPPEDSLPCAIDGVFYDTVIQFHAPATAIGYTIQTIKIDSITNLPCGLCWGFGASNLSISGNATGCIRVQGTTYDNPGEYLIKVYADVTVLVGGFIPVTVDNVYVDSVADLKYYARVRLPGGSCIPVDTLSPGLNASRGGTAPTLTINGNTSICGGGNTTLTAVDNAAGQSYEAFQWSTGDTTATLVTGTAGTYSVTVFANCASATASVTVVTGSPVVPSVSIVASVNPVCAGVPVTFTATPTNGGSTPTYQWVKNGNNVGTNSGTYVDAGLK